MKRGKLISIAGTDCSGKETQARLLVDRLFKEGHNVGSMSFPRYTTPTGRIIGGPYLGKEEICESWFKNGPGAVDPRVASLYYAADRRLALPEIRRVINSGKHLILDRYVDENLADQGGKIRDKIEREKVYLALEEMEYGFCELPRADETIFLYIPYKIGMELGKISGKVLDGHEKNINHLRNTEEACLELVGRNNWKRVDCVYGDEIKDLRSREDIHKEVYNLFIKLL